MRIELIVGGTFIEVKKLKKELVKSSILLKEDAIQGLKKNLTNMTFSHHVDQMKKEMTKKDLRKAQEYVLNLHKLGFNKHLVFLQDFN